MKKEMKFKIGDMVKPTNKGYGKRFIGKICDCWMNKPENTQIRNGEIVYIVTHHNYKGNMVMTYQIKESNLVTL
jgi:hypothetical protein